MRYGPTKTTPVDSHAPGPAAPTPEGSRALAGGQPRWGYLAISSYPWRLTTSPRCLRSPASPARHLARPSTEVPSADGGAPSLRTSAGRHLLRPPSPAFLSDVSLVHIHTNMPPQLCSHAINPLAGRSMSSRPMLSRKLKLASSTVGISFLSCCLAILRSCYSSTPR